MVQDNKLSGMRDGSPSRFQSENLREYARFLAMRGSGDRNNRIDGEEKEMEVEQLDEKEQMRIYKSDQSRSHFAMVRREFQKGKWYAKLNNGNQFTSYGFNTDVEAAVAASVAARVLAEEGTRSNPPFKCHDYLIHVTHGSRLPDSFENNVIKEFVKPCVELFVKIAKDVENKIRPMPQDPGMAEAIRCYREAVRYEREYQEGKVPPLKQAPRGENKRKRNLVESDGAASGANRPTSRVRR